MDDFISKEEKDYRFKLGTVIASSLSGFLAGFISASIVWILLIIVSNTLSQLQ